MAINITLIYPGVTITNVKQVLLVPAVLPEFDLSPFVVVVVVVVVDDDVVVGL